MVATQYTVGRAANWSLIPSYMQEGVDLWIMRGTPYAGDFLEAVIRNDLRRAVEHADDCNKRRLADYVTFFFNYAPSDCWGSPEKQKAWIACGGLLGLQSRALAEQVSRSDSAPSPRAG